MRLARERKGSGGLGWGLQRRLFRTQSFALSDFKRCELMQLVHSGPSGGLSLNPLRAESGWWGVHRLVWPGREFLEEETVLKFMAVISGRITEEADGKKCAEVQKFMRP